MNQYEPGMVLRNGKWVALLLNLKMDYYELVTKFSGRGPIDQTLLDALIRDPRYYLRIELETVNKVQWLVGWLEEK